MWKSWTRDPGPSRPPDRCRPYRGRPQQSSSSRAHGPARASGTGRSFSVGACAVHAVHEEPRLHAGGRNTEAEAGCRPVEIVDARRVRLRGVNGLRGEFARRHESTSVRLESFRGSTGVTNRCTPPASAEHGAEIARFPRKSADPEATA